MSYRPTAFPRSRTDPLTQLVSAGVHTAASGATSRTRPAHAVPVQRSVHCLRSPEPKGVITVGRGPRTVGFIDDIIITDAVVAALFDEVAYHLAAAVDQSFVDGLRLLVNQSAAPVSEQHRYAVRITEPENHVQVLHIARRVELPVDQV